MGKRSRFERIASDFYPTPFAAVPPLIPHLRRARVRRFAEPCAGDGALVRHLESFGLTCVYQGDLSHGQDALAVSDFGGVPVLTNPPWSRESLHRLIAHFMRAAPSVWLLFDADWAHTRQSAGLIRHCTDVVPVGRMKWIAGSKFTGKDNAAWYRFEGAHESGPIFHGRDSEPDARPTRTCDSCGGPFRPLRSDGRFCSDTCRKRAQRARLVVT
jgi:hypothetical protein